MSDVNPGARLVTFLGTGDYRATEYVSGDGPGIRTPYVARALADRFGAAEVRVLATDAAMEKHWEGLLGALRDAGLPVPTRVAFPRGADETELWEQFGILKEELRGAPEVVLDITHGFRAAPFFAAGAVAFVRAVDDAPCDLRVVYGAYDPRSGDEPTRVWDVTPFVDLVDWSRALGLFMRSGNAGAVVEPTRRLGRDLCKQWALAGREGDRPSLDNLAKAIEDFGADLVTVRTGELILGSAGDGKGSAARLDAAVRQARADAERHLPPLADVLDRLLAMVSRLPASSLFGREGHRAVASLARLYLDIGHPNDAVATVREGRVSRMGDGPPATDAGTPSFDRAARETADRRFGDLQGQQGSLVRVRNDLAHGGYRPDSQSAAKLLAAVEQLVAELEADVDTENP